MPELIDRQAVLAEIGEFQIRFNETGDSHERVAYASAEHCMLVIKAAPTIEPEVRHGRWIPTEYDSYADGTPVWDKWECSECGHEHSGEEDTLTAFCPDCGARMDATDTGKGGEPE